jgi:xanthosine utilization system XapX-like protein
MWNIFATTFIWVKTWLWDVIVKNTVPPLAAVIGVLGMSNVPAGKVLVKITRSVSTRVSVTVAVFPVVMCADA